MAKILARGRDERFSVESFPENAAPRSVAAKPDRFKNVAAIKTFDGVVKAAFRALRRLERQRVNDVRRPMRSLKGVQNELLAGSRTMKLLDDHSRNPKLALLGVPEGLFFGS